MRKLLSLAAIAAAVCTASAANATTFTGTFNVDLNTNANGLTVSASPNPGGVNFDLTNTGDFTNVEMFTLYADNESSVNGDDKVAQPISVDFTFSAPSGFGGSVGGTTVGESFIFGLFQDGKVTWNGPGVFNFGNGGILTVNLNDATFANGVGGLNDRIGADIDARFTLTQASVPEPASWALMIGGFGMAGAMLRRRRLVAA